MSLSSWRAKVRTEVSFSHLGLRMHSTAISMRLMKHFVLPLTSSGTGRTGAKRYRLPELGPRRCETPAGRTKPSRCSSRRLNLRSMPRRRFAPFGSPSTLCLPHSRLSVMLVGQGDERQVRPLRVSMRRLRPFEPPELGIPRVVDEPIGESRGGLSDRGFGAAARHPRSTRPLLHTWLE